MDFWESGMDLKHGDDIYDSFRTYQNKLLREYSSMADEFHFRIVDARRSVDHIQDELRKQVAAFLESVGKARGTGAHPLTPPCLIRASFRSISLGSGRPLQP